jgi:hypothetical protein
MNTVIHLGQMLVRHIAPCVLARLLRSAAKQRIGQGILRANQRFANYVRRSTPSDIDSMPSFNLVDDQPIR